MTKSVIGSVTRRASLRRLFSFPDPVNEVSARIVAGGVVALALLTITFNVKWLTLVIAYGFVARVLTGPSLSPLGQLATRVITPRLAVSPRLVPGPPKRFAQGIGAVFSVTVLVLTVVGQWTPARIALGLLIVAATLESVFAYCLGCKVFALLMRVGVVPDDVCERCNNVQVGSPPFASTSREPYPAGDAVVRPSLNARVSGADAQSR